MAWLAKANRMVTRITAQYSSGEQKTSAQASSALEVVLDTKWFLLGATLMHLIKWPVMA